ncbi:MAG: glycosyltransferase family 1 protein [Chlamydiales bacterium]
MKAKIGVEATPLSDEPTGVGNYVYYLLEALIELAPSYHFFLYAPQKTQPIERFRRFPNVSIRYHRFLAVSEVLWAQITMACMCWKDKIDLFWGTTQAFPLFFRKKQRHLLTIYDFTYRLFPQTTSRVRGGFMRLFSKQIYRKADCRMAISQGTAERLKTLYHIKADEVVIPPLKEGLRPLPQSELRPLLNKYQLDYKNYLLMVGTLEPRKNMVPTLDIYGSLLANQDLLPLVLVGKKGWRDDSIQQKIHKLQEKYPNKLRLLGYVDDQELIGLISGARFYLMPSLYEGYGMPIAEARSCGTSVICSDVPEMVEAAEEDGIFLSLERFEKDLTKGLTLKNCSTVAKCHYPSKQALASIILDRIKYLLMQR